MEMKGEMDLDDRHAQCPPYQDLVFYLPGLSDLVRPQEFRRNMCIGRQQALLRADGARSFAMSGAMPRLATLLSFPSRCRARCLD